MPTPKPLTIKPSFNLRSLSARGLGLAIEHLPCCILTVVAASIGIPFLSHNPLLELGFAVGGAMIGEYVGHKYIFNKHCGHGGHSHESRNAVAKRYAIALAIGLTTWGAHQLFFHKQTDTHVHHAAEAVHAEQVVTGKPATPTTVPARPQPQP